MCYFLNMDLTNSLIIGSAVVVILLLWVAVGVRHLKNLRRDIGKQWFGVDKGMRKRQDLVPLVVEVVKKYVTGQEKLVESLISERFKAAHVVVPTGAKVELEHRLTELLNKTFELGKDSVELKKDVYFLELRREIEELEKKVDNDSKQYNEVVRMYNRHRKSVMLRPLAAMMRMKAENIFEFEV